MMDITTRWIDFKQVVDTYTLPISYISSAGNYYLLTVHSGFQLVCRLIQGSADSIDFETNYKGAASAILS